jgi:PhzF family phenazine biosynthesis protein
MLLLQIDAFTAEPFKGNPAAVCLLDRERDAQWMQNVAMEMNLAETAFLLQRGDDWSLRWFTPTVEVDLCGHATLASAHALWEQHLHEGEIRFHTRSGVLTAKRDGEWIELDFPATREQRIDPPAELLEALNVKPVYSGKNKFDYILELESEEAVRNVEPDHALLRKLPVRGVIITSRPAAGREYDFVSRFFAPGAGVDEDPATGSAHCCLTPYWAERMGRNEFTAFQASPRGATLRVRLDGDRVKLKGRAVTVFRADLVV